ncbi:MAG: hypothetical protein IKF59_05000 [Lachnospiraceae bacterium]|nr:hypothetical protein [Lachnospiraceae bacterium]
MFAAEDRGNTSEVSVEKMAKEAAKEAGAAKGAAKEAASQAEMEEAAESDTSAAESDASKEAATEEAAESINGQGFEKETERITDKGFGEEAETSGEESGNTADTREAEGNTATDAAATDAAAAGENAAGDVTAGDTSVSDAEENTADKNTDTEDTELEEDTAGEMEADGAATGRDGQTEDSDDAAPSETDMENGTFQEKMITKPGDRETVLTDAMMSTVASGKCGTNLTWTLNDQGTLTISGTGKMNNYNYQGSPWYTDVTRQIEGGRNGGLFSQILPA